MVWIRKLGDGVQSFKRNNVLREIVKGSRLKLKVSSDHVMWWKERMELFKKPISVELVKRLSYTNLLGLDVSLKSGTLKEGTLNWEILQFKSRFPREVLLCRVGEFYEAIGIDACVLVEHAGLNPFGGLRSESIPRAGCPIMVSVFLFDSLFSLNYYWRKLPLEMHNLRQTLDDLTRNGYSVCIIEEVQGPAQVRSRKGRFIAGHAHPGSPYVFGLAGIDHDVDFPDPMPVVGISRSAKGFCITLVLETMKTYSTEDGLTEEAVVAKIRTCRYHYLFLHRSLRHTISDTSRWGEFRGGLLWGECSGKNYEWFEGSPVSDLLCKTKELYGLDDEVTFRNITVLSVDRPRPLHLGTATQIGVIPTEGIPSLLKVLLPSKCVDLPVLYIRDLLLNPPTSGIASAIQATCKLMSNVTCSIPEFTCVSAAKLVKLLESREVNHIEFCRIKNVVDEILLMYSNSELFDIVKMLLDPTWVSTGLKIEIETLVENCKWVSEEIDEMISLDGENDQKVCSYPNIPIDFFEAMESSWKGRVKRIHAEEVYKEVETAAKALSTAVTEDFLPIVVRVKAITAPLVSPKGEILYARDHEAVWFKGKRFTPSIWAGTAGEEQIKQLRPATESKGKKVGEEWFTTKKVEAELIRYRDAVAKAKTKVLELLRGLSAKLETRINILVFSAMLLVIGKALFAHVRLNFMFFTYFLILLMILKGEEGSGIFQQSSNSVNPSGLSLLLIQHGKFDFSRGHSHYATWLGTKSEDNNSLHESNMMTITGLSPYWFDVAQGNAIDNTVEMQSLFLLTGPNGGGKSSLLRSICAAGLLGICGLMVPADSAFIPHFDSIMLHMKSYDSPSDGKSSFQIEMSEIRSIITGATSKSLVLVDEICRGTETAKGTCIAGSIVEELDSIGCLGVISTHLHGIFDLPLKIKNTVCKAMGAANIDGQTKPTWKLIDGICRESLAFETAQREGIPETIIRRAEELYLSVNGKDTCLVNDGLKLDDLTCNPELACSDNEYIPMTANEVKSVGSRTRKLNSLEVLQKEVGIAVAKICRERLNKLYKDRNISEVVEVSCVKVSAKEQPPPSTVGASSIYVMFRPDKKLYVGQTDDLEGRFHSHRSNQGMKNALFIYVLVPGKSIACQLETLLINQLSQQGFKLTNVADGKHRNFGTTNISLENLTLQQSISSR
ncbi:hypothetical protein GIB67_024651 [Kingdonia uniflora]|uniref:DNA mismatch repair proteins mutS family domain-containing protein n=1 Tax=Kingdonia uniflora TaxID=39325 RepID=A0A7J7LPK5_9MAGN|nr:hypothetical protein GIB67_024651 [Kingdonia uniflora]